MSLTRRGRRGVAKFNPTSSSAVGGALGYLGLGAATGAGLGALGGALSKPQDVVGGAVAGGSTGVGVVAVGGFIIGLVSAKNRNVGFASAGIGFGALVLMNLATNIGANVATKS